MRRLCGLVAIAAFAAGLGCGGDGDGGSSSYEVKFVARVPAERLEDADVVVEGETAGEVSDVADGPSPQEVEATLELEDRVSPIREDSRVVVCGDDVHILPSQPIEQQLPSGYLLSRTLVLVKPAGARRCP